MNCPLDRVKLLAVHMQVDAAAAAESGGQEHERAYLKIALPEGSLDIGSGDATVGRDDACSLTIDSSWVRSNTHALM